MQQPQNHMLRIVVKQDGGPLDSRVPIWKRTAQPTLDCDVSEKYTSVGLRQRDRGVVATAANVTYTNTRIGNTYVQKITE